MASFDITSEVNWQEIDNAVQQARKEISTRFDFKGIQCEIQVDSKGKTISLTCSEEGKISSLLDVLQNKLVKRGVSLLSLDYGKILPASGRSVRQVIQVQAGISKEKGKEITKLLKDHRFKVQAQMQDEQLRVTGKSIDELQSVISLLKQQQDQLKVPMQFGNFRS